MRFNAILHATIIPNRYEYSKFVFVINRKTYESTFVALTCVRKNKKRHSVDTSIHPTKTSPWL